LKKNASQRKNPSLIFAYLIEGGCWKPERASGTNRVRGKAVEWGIACAAAGRSGLPRRFLPGLSAQLRDRIESFFSHLKIFLGFPPT
jgi:hypothetical protein